MLWHVFCKRDYSSRNTVGSFFHGGKRERHIAIFWDSDEFDRYSTLFHELLHNQQYISNGNELHSNYKDIPNRMDPIEMLISRIDDELAFRYLKNLPPIYMNPLPSSKLQQLAARLHAESPDFRLNSYLKP